MTEAIIIAVIASILGPSIVSIVNNWLTNKKRPANRFDEIHDKLDELANSQTKLEMKNDLWFMYVRYIDKKEFDTFAYQRARKCYAKYHVVGGNGEGTHLFDKLTEHYCEVNKKDLEAVIADNNAFFKMNYNSDWK